MPEAHSNRLEGRAAVIEALSEHPGVAALAAQLVDARQDRGEITLFVAPENFRAAAQALQAAGYNYFDDLTAVDWFPATPRFQLSCHLLSHGRKEYIRLATRLDEGATALSLTPVWPAANYFEREVFDLFGISFADHPNMRRILLPDEWVGHPLRKDYPVEGYR